MKIVALQPELYMCTVYTADHGGYTRLLIPSAGLCFEKIGRLSSEPREPLTLHEMRENLCGRGEHM